MRLSAGPVSVAWLLPILETPVENAFPGINVSFGSPKLQFNSDEESLVLSLSDVVFRRSDNEVIASSPFVELAISSNAFLRGFIQPRRITLNGSVINVRWSAEDFYAWSIGADSPDANLDKDVASAILAAIPEATINENSALSFALSLLSNEQNDRTLGRLERIIIANADVSMIEQDTGTLWHFPDAKFDFKKDDGIIRMDLDLQLEADGQIIGVSLNTRPGIEEGSIIDFNLQEVNLAALARSVGLGGLFQALDAPVFGSAQLYLNDARRIMKLEFAIGAGEGQLNLPSIYPTHPAIDQVELVGSYFFPQATLQIDRFSAGLATGSLTADGVVSFPGNPSKPIIRMFAELSNITIPDLLVYWPARLARGGHEWMSKNMPTGMIRQAQFAISMNEIDWDARPLPETALRIDMEFDGITAHYLDPMPPILNGGGHGHLTPNSLVLEISRGTIDELDIPGSSFSIENMAIRSRQIGHATIDLASSVPELLRLIDYEPLRFTSQYGLVPEAVSGRAVTSAELEFPLRKGTRLSDVDIKVEVEVRDLTMPALMAGGGLSDGYLNLDVTREGLVAAGPVRLKGVPLELVWSERFGTLPAGEQRSRYEISGTLVPEQLEAFGLPAVGRMEGTVRANAVILGSMANLSSGDVSLDLYNASFNETKLVWAKEVSTPGSAEFNLRWSGELVSIDNLVVESEGLELAASLQIARDSGTIHSAVIERLRTAGQDLSLSSVRSEDGSFELVIDAEKLALEGYIGDLIGGDGTKYVPRAMIKIAAREATLLNGVVINDLNLDALNAGGYWEGAEVSGRFASGGEFSLSLTGTDDARQLDITSDNTGTLALGVGLFLNGEGGEMTMSAALNGREQPRHSEGELLVENFRVVQSSALVSALAETKGYDVDTLIDEKGMSFDILRLPFVADANVIDIAQGRANGPNIGFTMEGQVDQGMNQMNINGLIIPAYSLNSFLAKIPIIGPFLGGGGDALFALSYRVEGPTDDLNVTFNPLSVIAPGILRMLFEDRKGTIDISDDPDDSEESTSAKTEGDR
jgi:AsmA-like C-terminal region/Protein of unknown function